MVAFNKNTDLPASVDTVEKLYIWATSVLSYVAPTIRVFEQVGQAAELAASGAVYDIAIPDIDWNYTVTFRYIGRCSLPVNINHKFGGQVWTYAETLSSAAIPSQFKT